MDGICRSLSLSARVSEGVADARGRDGVLLADDSAGGSLQGSEERGWFSARAHGGRCTGTRDPDASDLQSGFLEAVCEHKAGTLVMSAARAVSVARHVRTILPLLEVRMVDAFTKSTVMGLPKA